MSVDAHEHALGVAEESDVTQELIDDEQRMTEDPVDNDTRRFVLQLVPSFQSQSLGCKASVSPCRDAERPSDSRRVVCLDAQ